MLLVGTVILAIGFAGGFYLALLLQKQIEILIGAAILFAFLTWLGSGAELLGLLRDIYRQGKDYERQANKAILVRTEPFFKMLRPTLVKAIEAYDRDDIDNPTSTDSYVLNLGAFRGMMQTAYQDGTFRSIAKNASQPCETLEITSKKYDEDLARLTDIVNSGGLAFYEDTKLVELIKAAINEMDSWLEKWQKWAV
jgi:hypothetical protein